MSKTKRKFVRVFAGFLATCFAAAAALAWVFFHYTQTEIEPLLQDMAAFRKSNLDRIVVCLDGVSWSYIRRLQAEGGFRIFRPASKLIVTFPAMTNVSLSDIWRTEVTPGYESLYFDRNANSIGGGATTYIGKRVQTGKDYHSLLDYEEPRQYEFLVYVSPLRIISADLRRSILSFSGTEKRELRHYIKSSDGVIHIRGQEGASRFMKSLDSFLTTVYRANQERTEIIVFSDHGNDFVASRRVHLDSVLEEAGYRVGGSIEGPKGVVIPAFGLVSFAGIYANESERPGIAALLAGCEGVDFVVFRAAEGVHIVSQGGRASVYYDAAKDAYRYVPIDGDPLRLAKVQAELRRQGKMDGEDWISSRDWFDSTWNEEYPDALHRIWKSLGAQVDYPADLLISFKAGYFYGSRTFNRFFGIEATHGSLRPDSSEAFLMSTHRDYPAALRGEDLLSYVGTTVAFESRMMLHPAGSCEDTPH